MGIKNLHRFLKKHIPLLYRETSISEYRNKTIAIDTNIYLYRYKSIHKDKWLNTFLSLILMLKKYDIQIIFIYDTKAPIEKNSKKEERKTKKKLAEKKVLEIINDMEKYDIDGTISPLLQTIIQKRSHRVKKLLDRSSPRLFMDKESISKEIESLNNQIININKYDINLSKQLLECLGIPYYNSETEAETLCAYLCCHGKVDAVLSDDTDVLVYGTPIFVTKLNLQNEVFTEIRYDEILKELELTPQQFTDLCIMCGTDYNKNIPKIGNEKAYKLLHKYASLDDIQSDRTDLDLSILNYKRVREIFSIPLELDDYRVTNKSPNLQKFQEFNLKHNKLQLNSTRIKIINDIVKKNENIIYKNQMDEKYITDEQD